MPSAEQILEILTQIADNARPVAVIWHILLGIFIVAIIAGWRPSRRLTAIFLAMPLLTVSIFSWIYGNPFNGVTFLIVTILMIYFGVRSADQKIEISTTTYLIPGATMFVFGWIYPHFLENAPIQTYAYSAPVGLVPCSTLSIIIGFALILNGLNNRALAWTLVVAGLFYGLFGAFRLGVMIDLILLAGAILLASKLMFTSKIADAAQQ